MCLESDFPHWSFKNEQTKSDKLLNSFEKLGKCDIVFGTSRLCSFSGKWIAAALDAVLAPSKFFGGIYSVTKKANVVKRIEISKSKQNVYTWFLMDYGYELTNRGIFAAKSVFLEKYVF